MAKAGVLVTRPSHQTQHLSDLLARADINPIPFPTLAIVPVTTNKLLTSSIQQLANADYAIFVSANAVLYSKNLIHETWPVLPKPLKILAVGKATAQALQNAGLRVDIYPHDYNSEGLLALIELQQLQGKTAIIFQGEGGRGFLAPELKKRGARIIEAIVYQRRCPDVNIEAILPDLKAQDIKIIIGTSSESLANLFTLIPDTTWLCSKSFVVISERVAKKAYELGVKNIAIAKSASDNDIVATCLALLANNR